MTTPLFKQWKATTNMQLKSVTILTIFCLLPIPYIKAQTEGTIQLVRDGVASQAYTSGRVQVWLDSQWGNICGDKTTSPFTLDEGDVACRQLGYTGASSVTIATEDSHGVDTSPTIVDQFNCHVSDFNLVLLQCKFSTIINPINCDDNDDVGISCYTSRLWIDPFPGMVRLQNGTYSSEGTVEIFCNGLWTTVCGDTITSDDSDTVCLQLGYKGTQNITTSVSTATNSTLQWFESLSCGKPESCTSSCQSCPGLVSPAHSCATDAYVYCHYSLSVKTYNATPSTIYTCTSGYYPHGDGAVRLSRGDLYSLDYSSGRVQVYYNGVWGNLCRQGGFDSVAADVICHQTGWTGASGWSYAAMDSFPTDVRVTHYSNITCTNSQYLVIQQCSYTTTLEAIAKCTDDDDVSVTCYDTRIWDNPFRGMIRLTGSNFVSEGRVEVYCNSAWGTVCNRDIDSTDRRVICEQLGYNQVVSEQVSDSALSSADSSVPVWLDSLICLDSDSYKCVSDCQDCPLYPSTNSECSNHDNDVTVQCYIDPESQPVSEDFSDCQITDSAIGSSSEGSMVFHSQGLDSSTLSGGIVVVYHRGEWGNVCHGPSFTVTEADVICHQMMYTGASSYGATGTTNHQFGIDSRTAVLTDLSCSSGHELTALQCSFTDGTSIPLSCGDQTDLIVTCYNTKLWDTPYPGMVRLMDGDFTNEGRVEVYCSGTWGTVCGIGFETADAEVVCRQLGYTEANVISTRSVTDDRPVWLDSLQCESKPSQPSCISSCQLCPVTGSSKCTHLNDATVHCFHSSSGDSSVQSSGLNEACALDSQLPSTAQSGAMILYQNGNYSRSYTLGRVLVNYNGRWGTICRKESFGNTEADVICHQLTYSGASDWLYAAEDKFSSNPLPVIFKDVSCSDPNYMTLFQCSLSTSTVGCTIDDAISVSCYSSRVWNNPFDLSVRLSSGNYANEGLIEVYCNGEWGTVCNRTFTDTVGTSACRQLGYHSYRTSLQIRSGSRDQTIWLDQLSCSAESNCLYNCQECPGSGHGSQCTHDQDVSIQCTVSKNLEEESNDNVIESCLVVPNYLVYIVAGSCGGALLLCVIITFIICCIRVQRNKGNCPKPCGHWEVEVDEVNAGPLSLSMQQRNRKTPITVPVVSEDDPPPYDLTNCPPLSTDPDKPPGYEQVEDGYEQQANEHEQVDDDDM